MVKVISLGSEPRDVEFTEGMTVKEALERADIDPFSVTIFRQGIRVGTSDLVQDEDVLTVVVNVKGG